MSVLIVLHMDYIFALLPAKWLKYLFLASLMGLLTRFRCCLYSINVFFFLNLSLSKWLALFQCSAMVEGFAILPASSWGGGGGGGGMLIDNIKKQVNPVLLTGTSGADGSCCSSSEACVSCLALSVFVRPKCFLRSPVWDLRSLFCLVRSISFWVSDVTVSVSWSNFTLTCSLSSAFICSFAVYSSVTRGA